MQHLRVRIVGVGKPSFIRTVHRTTTLTAGELRHMLSKEESERIIPPGSAIQLDFDGAHSVGISHTCPVPVRLDSQDLTIGQQGKISRGENRVVAIGDTLMRITVFGSHFS